MAEYKIKLRVKQNYTDLQLDKDLKIGNEIEVGLERAKKLLSLGYVEILYMPKLPK